MTRLSELKNIGPTSAEWLAAVGIETAEQLAELGSVEAYRRVRAAFPKRASLNLLWGLEAALLDIRWDELPADLKASLRREVEGA